MMTHSSEMQQKPKDLIRSIHPKIVSTRAIQKLLINERSRSKKLLLRFDMAVDSVVGNGESILFWTDRWLGGSTLAELAPNLLQAIPRRVFKSRTVAQAL